MTCDGVSHNFSMYSTRLNKFRAVAKKNNEEKSIHKHVLYMYVSYTYLLRLELGEMSISVCVCVCVDARFYKWSFLKKE